MRRETFRTFFLGPFLSAFLECPLRVSRLERMKDIHMTRGKQINHDKMISCYFMDTRGLCT